MKKAFALVAGGAIVTQLANYFENDLGVTWFILLSGLGTLALIAGVFQFFWERKTNGKKFF